MESLVAILFFVPGGKPNDAEKREATALSTRTGKKVVFRDTHRPPEPSPAVTVEAVAGEVPESFKSFPPAESLPDAPAPSQASEETVTPRGRK